MLIHEIGELGTAHGLAVACEGGLLYTNYL